MFIFVLGILCAVAAIGFWTLQRSYEHVPARELKRSARAGDEVAALLYRAAAYGVGLRTLLGGGAVVLAAIALVCMVNAIGVVWGMVSTALLIGIGAFVWLPNGELSRSSVWIAKQTAPAWAWLLERIYPVIALLARLARRYRHVHVHTGLYEKTDLAELLEQQRGQEDSRITASEVDLLLHSLSFGDKQVVDAMVPKRVVKTIAATDGIGPVMMDELSRSGHSRFPVYDGKHDHIVGVLFLRDLVADKRGGTVADVMHKQLTYVHEDFTLYQTLQAFLKTKQHLFLVVNSFEELVGIITIEDVLEQMIGHQIVDEFDRYDDLRAVAAAAAHKDHTERQKAKSEPKIEADATADPPEVVK